MNPLTRQQFRRLFLAGAVIWLGGLVMGMLDFPYVKGEERALLDWNYYGSIFPIGLLNGIYWYSILAYGAGICGMLLFKGWGRSLFLFANSIWVFSAPFMGWIVYPPVAMGLSGVGGEVLLVLLGLSYFPPHSEFFRDVPRKKLEES